MSLPGFIKAIDGMVIKRVLPDDLDARYGVVMAEAIREEIRRADKDGIVYFTHVVDLAVRHMGSGNEVSAEFKRAA